MVAYGSYRQCSLDIVQNCKAFWVVSPSLFPNATSLMASPSNEFKTDSLQFVRSLEDILWQCQEFGSPSHTLHADILMTIH